MGILRRCLVLMLLAPGSGFFAFSQYRCSPIDPEPTIWSVTSAESRNWSDPDAWNLRRVPTPIDIVQIGRPGNASNVTIDISASVAQTIICNGTLSFARESDLTFTTNFLGVQSDGVLAMGTAAGPITRQVTLRLGGKPVAPPPVGYYGGHAYDPRDLGLQVARGGTWYAHGQALVMPEDGSARTSTELTETANPNATYITVAERVDRAGWQVGKKIVIAQTETVSEYNGNCHDRATNQPHSTLQDQNEVVTITGFQPLDGGRLRINIRREDVQQPGLRFRHEVGPFDEIDQLYRQAHVIYLERNLKVTSINYPEKPSHVLIAPGARPPILKYVEFLKLGPQAVVRRCGGQGQPRCECGGPNQPVCEPNRYPTHSHVDGGVFEGLSYHHSKRSHLVLHHRGPQIPETQAVNNIVRFNTFYDEFPFQGASIWVAVPPDETDPTSIKNVIEYNVILIPPRTCAFDVGELTLADPTPFLAGIFVQHPTQSINYNVVSGGFYAYWLNPSAAGAATAPIISFDGNLSYVGDCGLTLDSNPQPYRPTTTQRITNFKAWGYLNNVLSFDANNVVLDEFKLFDSIGGVDGPDDTSACVRVDSRERDTVLDTVTLRNSVLQGTWDPDNKRYTNLLILIGDDRLVVDATADKKWKFKGSVGMSVIVLAAGEGGNIAGVPGAVGKFDFGPAQAPWGSINMGFNCGEYPILDFGDDHREGTNAVFCHYPTTSTCGDPGLCKLDPLSGGAFRLTPGESPDCPQFSTTAVINSTTCAAE